MNFTLPNLANKMLIVGQINVGLHLNLLISYKALSFIKNMIKYKQSNETSKTLKAKFRLHFLSIQLQIQLLV